MFKEYIDQLGSQFSLLESTYIALAICITILLLLRWLGLGRFDFSQEEWRRLFKELPWWKSSTVFVSRILLGGLRGGAEGMAAAMFLLVIAYHIYPELGAIRGN
jgi:hypothetical protein